MPIFANHRNFHVFWEIGVKEHNVDVIFQTGGTNKTVLCMHIEKYATKP